MIISIASGKGGTGKTTVATNLAFSIGENVQLLDCDVEEPNCHLFLKPEITERQTALTPVPKIDHEKCTFCKKCAEICQFNAIAVLKDTTLVFEELCHGCGGCQRVCEYGAITETGRELGVIEKGHKGNIQFGYGRLRVGEAMSPPLIRMVRNLTDPRKINIIDAPPGTSCPVIAAMNGVDFVLLVTEPTPFGLNDLTLAVEAVKLLKIPTGLVINRSDIGDNEVQRYARSEGIPILMEIPFDRKIAASYAGGKLIAEDLPGYREKFLRLFQKIEASISHAGVNK